MTLAPGTRSAPTKSSPRSAPAAWARSTAPATRASAATSRSRCCRSTFAPIPRLRARFEREARPSRRLNHPHICTLHDVGREGDTDYLVMELVEGETLAPRLARGPLPVADVLRLGVQIADALDRAHRAGIVHRDLKPGNIMLTKAGAKLLDFGLARAAAPAAAARGDATIARPR